MFQIASEKKSSFGKFFQPVPPVCKRYSEINRSSLQQGWSEENNLRRQGIFVSMPAVPQSCAAPTGALNHTTVGLLPTEITPQRTAKQRKFFTEQVVLKIRKGAIALCFGGFLFATVEGCGAGINALSGMPAAQISTTTQQPATSQSSDPTGSQSDTSQHGSNSLSDPTSETKSSTAQPAALNVQNVFGSAQVGSFYVGLVYATGGTPLYTWSVTAGKLPDGLVLSSITGLVYGTPTQAGAFSFTMTATDSAKQKASQSLSLTIAPKTLPLSIGTGSLSNASASTAYTANMQASGGTPGYTWVITRGSLPSGLSLSSAGILSGTPTASGTYSFTLSATDSGAPRQTASQALSLRVAPPLVINASSLSSGMVGTSYSATEEASGGTPAYTWSVKSGSLPSGLTLAATTGVISGTPSQPGTYSFTLAAKDNGSPVQTQTAAASITIAAPAYTTWYVRADGGTRYSTNQTQGQCDGMADAAYPGTGTNQHCAFNDVRLLWQDGSYAYNPGLSGASNFPANGWVGKGGDWYIIKGSIAAGTTPYRIGWQTNDSAIDSGLSYGAMRGWAGDPAGSGAPTPPAGSATQHTRILGENWQNCHAQTARTPIIGGHHVGTMWNFSTSYVDFQCFDLSDQWGDKYSTAVHDEAVAAIGLQNTADHLTLTDIRMHGLSTFGMLGPSGDGSVFSYIAWIGNGGGGWNADAGDGKTGLGTLLVQNYEISWNGCAEEYPIVDALPYQQCNDQNSGGYGDGFGTATVTSQVPGWQVHFDQGVVSYNAQDGLDALHLVGNGSSMTVTRTLAYGNMGQQIKIGGSAGTADNNIIVGNCDAMAKPIPGAPPGFNAHLSDFCRAGNQPVALTMGHNATTRFRHNTVIGNGALLISYACDNTAGACDNTAVMDLRDNVLLGNTSYDRGNPGANYIIVGDDTYKDAASCNAAPDGHHAWTTDGFTGCNNNIFFNPGSYNDHNIYYQVKDACTDNNGTNNLCMDPGLVTEVQPSWGYPDLRPSPNGSAAYHAGSMVPGLAIDYSGLTFAVPPTIGALETGSSILVYSANQ